MAIDNLNLTFDTDCTAVRDIEGVYLGHIGHDGIAYSFKSYGVAGHVLTTPELRQIADKLDELNGVK